MDNQNKIGMFLVAIVAVVAVVGIVLQFSGSSSGLDVSATGQAVNARFNVDSAKVLDGAPAVEKKEEESGMKIDTGIIAEGGVAAAARDTGDTGGFGEIDQSSDEYMTERYQEGCNSCARGALNAYNSCVASAASQANSCADRLDTSAEEYTTELVECQQEGYLAVIECQQDYTDAASQCESAWTNARYDFQCTVPSLTELGV